MRKRWLKELIGMLSKPFLKRGSHVILEGKMMKYYIMHLAVRTTISS